MIPAPSSGSARRFLRFSLRTLFVVVTLAALAAMQWRRIERLNDQWEYHTLAAYVGKATDWNAWGPVTEEELREHEPYERWRAAMRDWHSAMADRCASGIWMPWREMTTEPAAPPEPPWYTDPPQQP